MCCSCCAVEHDATWLLVGHASQHVYTGKGWASWQGLLLLDVRGAPVHRARCWYSDGSRLTFGSHRQLVICRKCYAGQDVLLAVAHCMHFGLWAGCA